MKKLTLLVLLAFPIGAQDSPPPVPLTIDCGSQSDQYFIGGSAYPITLIPGATGDLTVRFGVFSYHISEPAGVYLVTLNFRETGTVTAANQRPFSVKLNGQLVLDRFDLFATAGLNPRERNYVTASNDGFIDIDFSIPAGAPKGAIVSSIVVQQLFTGPPPPPVASTFPAIAEWAVCKSGEVFAGPIGPGVPPGSMWPGVKRQDAGYAYSCDGLQYYKFKLADGTVTGPYVAVRMPDDFAADPDIWVKQ